MNATTYAVSGASGGLGASTFALQLAIRLAELTTSPALAAARVVLIDADQRRGAADVMAGVEHLDGLRWSDLAGLSGAADGARILPRLPACGPVSILAGGRPAADLVPPDALREVLAALTSVSTAVVLDLGQARSAGESHWWGAVDRHVLLSGVGVRHLVDVERAMDAVPAEAHLQVITRGPGAVARLGERVAEHVGARWGGHWRDDRRIARALERGTVPTPRLPRQLVLTAASPTRGPGLHLLGDAA